MVTLINDFLIVLPVLIAGSIINFLIFLFYFKDSLATRIFYFIIPSFSALAIIGFTLGKLGTQDYTIISGITFLAMVAIIGNFFLIDRFFNKLIIVTMDQVNEGQLQISDSTQQLAESSQDLASSSSQQAASVQQISASIEELLAMTKQNHDNTSVATELSQKSRDTANTGLEYVKQIQGALKANMKGAEESSLIIKTIDEIAFQTNLLALNAAVEAARAGQAGLGFAVVAEEVRRLAQRSSEAARQTSDIIEQAQTQIKRSVDISNEANETFEEINRSATQVNQINSEINSASNEQMLGLEQLKDAIYQIDNVTQKVASSAEEIAASAEEMDSMTNIVRNSTDHLSTITKGSNASNIMKVLTLKS